LKPEERTIQPIIFDILDATFMECHGQWAKRKKFYKTCGYDVRWKGEEKEKEKEKEKGTTASVETKGVCVIEDE
jgi:hypothetical protein